MNVRLYVLRYFKTLGFRGFDSNIIFILRGGIPRPVGDFSESLSQGILVGIILVGRLGVPRSPRQGRPDDGSKESRGGPTYEASS